MVSSDVKKTGMAVVGGVKRGRPKGSKNVDGYNVSEDALLQRRMAALKDGSSSKILSKYLSGVKSPVPMVADSDIQSLRRELYLNNLVRMVDEPTIVTMDVLAWLLGELELAKLQADGEGEVLSDKLLKAAKLATELSTGLSKLKHGSKQTIEVKKMRDVFDDGEMVIPIRVERVEGSDD